ALDGRDAFPKSPVLCLALVGLEHVSRSLPEVPGLCDIGQRKPRRQGDVCPRPSRQIVPMKPVLKTNNVVLLSFARDVLAQAGIESLVFDENASIMDGSLGIVPRRLM